MKYPKNVKVKVVCLPDSEESIRRVFFEILEDYCERFQVLCTDKPTSVSICLVHYEESNQSSGSTIVSEDNTKMIIQLRDTYLSGWEDNSYTLSGFMEVLCHEVVHVCQHLTGRSGFKVPKMKFDKTNPREAYFFDPYEVEARVLSSFYVEKYANKLV